MTRWNMKDLTGRLINAQKETKADQWEVIEFPAILPNNKPVWPEYWKLEELESVKASLSIGKWNAQYQQNPTAKKEVSLNANGGTYGRRTSPRCIM